MDKRLSSLRPEFRKVAETWLHIVRDDLHVDARVTETLRSRDRQKELAVAGKTNVETGWHNVGMALDFLCYHDGVVIHDGEDRDYTRCGLVAQALDCRWPIYISHGRKDAGHIEWHPGFTLQQFLDGQKGGLVA